MASLRNKLLNIDCLNGGVSIRQPSFLARRAGYMALTVFNKKFLDNVAFAYAARARRIRDQDECGAGGAGAAGADGAATGAEA